MFKELLRAWRGESLLNDVLGIFDGMLVDGEDMYRKVSAALFEEGAARPERDGIFEADRRINKAEREIRRMLAEHLAISQSDVGACLVLMSTVKDAERIGDYAKNLFEVLELGGAPLPRDGYVDELAEIGAGLRDTFRDTRACFRGSDATLARQVIDRNKPLLTRCDALLDRLVEDEVPTRQAVAYTLVARYLKRIGSHLGNIASSVILPVHQINYPSKIEG